MKTGVFWVIDDELIAIPFYKFKYVEGIAKSGETYNYEKLQGALYAPRGSI